MDQSLYQHDGCIPVFFSYPQPFNRRQERFVLLLVEKLRAMGIEPRTVGVTSVHHGNPMDAIRQLINESSGLLVLALRRLQVTSGISKPVSDNGHAPQVLDEQWLTSPFSHIEPAMAFQAGLPILAAREKGVLAHGMLDSGITGPSLTSFDLDQDHHVQLNASEWTDRLLQWKSAIKKFQEMRRSRKNTDKVRIY